MKRYSWMAAGAAFLLAFTMSLEGDGAKIVGLITGKAAFSDAKDIKAGSFRKITVADLPNPHETPSGRNMAMAKMTPGELPQVAPGFKVEAYIKDDLKAPRQIRRAPNGDLFFTEQTAGNIKIIHDNNGKPEVSTFATGMTLPFGINFYPVGPNPQWVYIGNTGSVVRFPYKNGDMKATGPAETLISDLPPRGNHQTRDIVFTKDGKRMLVAVGSVDNVGDTKGNNEHRANILEYTPEGKFVQIYASGIRNPVGLAIDPRDGVLWTSVNERDELGDNLVPDYITSVKEGGFYGWPWFYIGQHADDRSKMPRPADKTMDKVIVPDVLMQPHNASLGLTFYDGTQFPAEYRGDIFAAEHGSWNRAVTSGHEVVRVPLNKGKSDGVYEDFMTFIGPDGGIWGRATGVAVGKDGSLYVTDDNDNIIWKVSYTGK